MQQLATNHASNSLPNLPYGRLEHLSSRIAWALKQRKNPQANENLYHNLAFPQARTKLLKELEASQKIGKTPDGKLIYLCRYRVNSAIIKELGRLREISFRTVGEGTNSPLDIDRYDKTYQHIVLWDEKDLEIVGAYRIGEAYKLVPKYGVSALYTSELFDYSAGFAPYFESGIELGRSFIQPRYWGKRSLDYLWQGIGAYLNAHPQVRYTFGGISISNDYPEIAKQQIVSCYSHYFGSAENSRLAKAKLPYRADRSLIETYRDQSYEQGIRSLQLSLRRQGLNLPTLYKHYGEFCEERGIKVIDFNIDPAFNHCIDGLMVADLNYVRAKKFQRYIQPHAS